MKEEMKDYIMRNYTHLLSNEESELLNKMHSYHNLVRCERVHGIEEMKDKYHLFELDEYQVKIFRELNEDELRMEIAQNIFERHKNEIFINACPVCGGVARTIAGRQCRNGHRW